MKSKPFVVVCAHLGMFMLAVIITANGLDAARRACCLMPKNEKQMACHENMKVTTAKKMMDCCSDGHCAKCPAPALLSAQGNTEPAIVLDADDDWAPCDGFQNTERHVPQRPPMGFSSL